MTKKPKMWHFHNLNRHFWIDAIRKVVPRSPSWFVAFGRYCSVIICFLYMRQERRAMLSNFRNITGKSWFGCFVSTLALLNNYAKQLVAFSLHDYYPDEYWQQKVVQKPEEYNKILKALEYGKGVLLISAHLGSWELGKHVLAVKNKRVNMVMVPTEDSSMEDFWNRFRSREGLHIINLKESPYASIEILNALRNNEIVVLHGDRIFNQSCRQATFFGKPTYFPAGPVELARLSGTRVLGAYILITENDGYRVQVDDDIKFEWSGNREIDVQHNIEQMARMLERYVRKYATQWYTFYDFWQKPPALKPMN